MSFLNFQASELAKRAGRGAVNSISELSGRSDASFNKLSTVPSWTILGYHRIIDNTAEDPFDFGMCTSVDNFQRQIDFLKTRFRIETVQTALRMIDSGSTSDKPILSITFDDGYLDNHAVVLPMLEKAGLKASFYICTSDLNNGKPFWWDRVIFALAHTEKRELSLNRFDLDSAKPKVSLAPYKRRYALSIILQALWSTDYRRCLEIVGQLEQELDAKADHYWAARMSSSEIRALQNAGMEIGCHNSVHHDMTLMHADEVTEQLKTSGAEISAIIGEWPQGFAYPAGAQSDETRKCVSETAYSYALGTERGLNPWSCERLNLKRMSVGNNSISDFKRCLSALADTHVREYAQQGASAHLAGSK